jgi:hypothetical protein
MAAARRPSVGGRIHLPYWPAMTDYRTCKHCGGTTFCGGFKNAEGQLKTRTACTTCVIKSALNPKVVYDKVVCSVCNGTGIVRPGEESGRALARSRPLLLLVVALLGVSGVSLAFSIMAFTHEQRRLQQQTEKLAEEAIRSGPGIPLEELRARLAPGMSQDQVRTESGRPTGAKQIATGFTDVELWSYQCTDGRIELTFHDGKLEPLPPAR